MLESSRIFTGIATEFGARVQDVFNRGFYSVVNYIVCLHQITLENMKNLITIINSKELENI